MDREMEMDIEMEREMDREMDREIEMEDVSRKKSNLQLYREQHNFIDNWIEDQDSRTSTINNCS